MADTTHPISLDAALAFHTLDDGGLSAPVPGHFSNGRSGLPPEKGFPFGGLLAALVLILWFQEAVLKTWQNTKKIFISTA